MKKTTNYNLNEPETSDTVGVTIPALATNMVSIDTLIKSSANTALLATNGYFKDATTGFTLQWGSLTVNTGGGSHVTFSTPFAVALYSVVATNWGGTATVINTASLSGFNIGMVGITKWIAVGR